MISPFYDVHQQIFDDCHFDAAVCDNLLVQALLMFVTICWCRHRRKCSFQSVASRSLLLRCRKTWFPFFRFHQPLLVSCNSTRAYTCACASMSVARTHSNVSRGYPSEECLLNVSRAPSFCRFESILNVLRAYHFMDDSTLKRFSSVFQSIALDSLAEQPDDTVTLPRALLV